MRRGEIWLYQFKHPDKTRPVLILTRNSILPYLHEATVAPITSTIRGIPTEILVGTEEGLKKESAINLDHLQTVAKQNLTTFIGTLSNEKMQAVLEALLFALGFR
ncbi:MAG: type II toxin-antitoxin system PemK/MazF family toxin [Deltaproteobacteria bacterium]|nr:type II toxin-antitoxin system PemK/MazF family toxin [Deltaproteobacteria bacterium]